MATIARTFQQHNIAVTSALILAALALLIISPAEVTLGNVVKIVYAHGAAERVSFYAYLLSGVLGLGYLGSNRVTLAHWTQALLETAIIFWIAQFAISLPAQVLAWGGLTWNEPRVIGAVWIFVLTLLVYMAARWIGDTSWMALAAVASAAIVLVVLGGSANVLHPLNAIAASNSVAIKMFYAAIVAVGGVLAFQVARMRAMDKDLGETYGSRK